MFQGPLCPKLVFGSQLDPPPKLIPPKSGIPWYSGKQYGFGIAIYSCFFSPTVPLTYRSCPNTSMNKILYYVHIHITYAIVWYFIPVSFTINILKLLISILILKCELPLGPRCITIGLHFRTLNKYQFLTCRTMSYQDMIYKSIRKQC